MYMFRPSLLITVYVQLFGSLMLCWGCLFYFLFWHRRLPSHGRSRVEHTHTRLWFYKINNAFRLTIVPSLWKVEAYNIFGEICC